MSKISKILPVNNISNEACGKCGQAFFCGFVKESSHCWCFNQKKLSKVDPKIKSCLCPSCYDQALALDAAKYCYRAIISYDGRLFCGFQTQDGQRTVQEEVLKAIKRAANENLNLVVAGRTDANVHAKGQVISFKLKKIWELKKLSQAIASYLPLDIGIKRIDSMPIIFNARFHSIGKEYKYQIFQGLNKDPFQNDFAWHIKRPLDLKAMKQAAEIFLGEHDFESFRSTQCVSAHAKRYIWALNIKREGDLVKIYVRGNAFCHNMVRIIVGTLVYVGLAKIEAGFVKKIILAKERSLAGPTAKAKGLFLNQVFYPDEIEKASLNIERFPRYPDYIEEPPYEFNLVRYGQQ